MNKYTLFLLLLLIINSDLLVLPSNNVNLHPIFQLISDNRPLRTGISCGNQVIISVIFYLHKPLDYYDLQKYKFCASGSGHNYFIDCRAIEKTFLTYIVPIEQSSMEKIFQLNFQIKDNDNSSIIINARKYDIRIAPISYEFYGLLNSPLMLSKYVTKPVVIVLGSLFSGSRDIVLNSGGNLHMIVTVDSLPMCQDTLGITQCCSIYNYTRCLPLVADIGILSIASFTTNNITRENLFSTKLISLLRSLIKYKLFVVSELDVKSTLKYIPSLLVSSLSLIPSPVILPSTVNITVLVTSTMLIYDNNIIKITYPLHSFPSNINFKSHATFSFRYGINIAVMNHVCLLNHTSIALFRDINATTPIITNKLQKILAKSNSGFYVTIQDHTGWNFIESTYQYHAGSHPPLIYSLPQSKISLSLRQSFHQPIVWFRGTTALLTPSYSNSIFHFCQVLLVLVHASLHPDQHPWILQLDRIILPTTTRNGLQWSLGLANVIVYFIAARREKRDIPKVYLREDIDILFYDSQYQSFSFSFAKYEENDIGNTNRNRNSYDYSQQHSDTIDEHVNNNNNNSNKNKNNYNSFIGFEEVIVCGTIELSTPFLSTKYDANTFRNFIYDYFKIDNVRRYNKIDSHNRLPYTSTSSDSSNGASTSRHPNTALRITIVSRPANRWLLNIHDLTDRIIKCGVANVSWLLQHVSVQLESLSFVQQIKLLRLTDILITPHGAGIQNLMFMEENSAVIEIMTAPWYEPGYQATALSFGIAYYVLPQTNIKKVFDCSFPSDCISEHKYPLLIHRKDLKCYGMRQCNVEVELDAFEVLLWQAVQHVRILKGNLANYRLNNDHLDTSNSCIDSTNINIPEDSLTNENIGLNKKKVENDGNFCLDKEYPQSDFEVDPLWYMKAYDKPL